MNDFSVEETLPADSPDLAALLAASGLPVDDLNDPGRRFFRFTGTNGELIGMIGAEAAGQTVLLRSLAVVPGYRGKGWGKRILTWALEKMKAEGYGEVYALTTTIEPLLAHWGWIRITRADAPAEIRASRQFAHLCPASAALMRRRFGEETSEL